MNKVFGDASGRIQAAGSGRVARAAPNAESLVGVCWTPEMKRKGGGPLWDGMDRNKGTEHLGKEKGPSGCTRGKT